MALSNTELTALATLVRREGLDSFLDAARDLTIKDRKTAAATALGSAVSVTVSDWTAVTTFIASQTSNAALISVLSDIDAAIAAKDQTKLGALLTQLYATVKIHLGK